MRENSTNNGQLSRSIEDLSDKSILFLNLHHEKLEADEEQWKRLYASPNIRVI